MAAAILIRASRQPVRTGRRGRPARVVPPEVRVTHTVTHRDDHSKLLSIEIRAVLGEVVSQPGTVHRERVNCTLRDRLTALTRKTYACATRDATWDALVFLPLFEHHWIRSYHALRLPIPSESQRDQPRPPAMALGLTHHPWPRVTFLTTSLYATPQ
jgi:hypothetical protein